MGVKSSDLVDDQDHLHHFSFWGQIKLFNDYIQETILLATKISQ